MYKCIRFYTLDTLIFLPSTCYDFFSVHATRLERMVGWLSLRHSPFRWFDITKRTLPLSHKPVPFSAQAQNRKPTYCHARHGQSYPFPSSPSCVLPFCTCFLTPPPPCQHQDTNTIIMIFRTLHSLHKYNVLRSIGAENRSLLNPTTTSVQASLKGEKRTTPHSSHSRARAPEPRPPLPLRRNPLDA
jgi:hypothetical protein